MSVRNLSHMFQPRSVAVIGASPRPASVGGVVMRNLLAAGFDGPILPVNPRHHSVAGVLAYPNLAALPEAPDLAVVCTPPATVPGLIADLGARGTRAAVVLTAGLARERDADGRRLDEAMLAAARPHLLRVLGPNCVGLLVPGAKLNASFSHMPALPGRIAFVSQSGALCTAVLDWAQPRGIGFSCFVSLGDGADVDFGDVLDYLASDADTRAILLYIEAVTSARKFMSAARAAARNKPVIVIKAGRVAEGARAAASHTGAMAGSDDVYDAAIRRAGMLRVDEMDELFDAVETLARARPLAGDRLAILTNGGGPAVIATDLLVMRGGHMATLDAATTAALDAFLPATWSRGNPIDIIGDAPIERYAQALDVLLEAPGIDAVLVVHAPTAIVSSEAIAAALAPRLAAAHRPVLTSWVGEAAVAAGRRHFVAAGIPTYETPGKAVTAFQHLIDYRRNQDALTQVPPTAPREFVPDRAGAGRIIAAALDAGHAWLSEAEAKGVLAAYGVPVVETRVAADAGAAARAAEAIGFPVAVKVLSPDLTHKSDVGGVVLDIETAAAVEAAVDAMTRRLQAAQPSARIEGFTVQPMVRRPRAHELILGASMDPVFGPVVLFGQGGVAVEVLRDRALGLPPLNLALARNMIERTRVARLLHGYRDRAAADLDAVALALVQVAQLITDFGEIQEIDVNPLLADERGVVALDARMRVARADRPGPDRLAIRPYPEDLEDTIDFAGRPVRLRPIRPEDEATHRAFLGRVAPEDMRLRFFAAVKELPHSELARFTQIDYDREMAFIATASDGADAPETLGVVRAVADPDNEQAEFAVLVRSDLKGQGLGRCLMEKIIAYCRARGTGRIRGEVLRENRAMLTLAKDLGFRVLPGAGDGETVEIALDLQGA